MPPPTRADLSRKVQNAVLASISDPSFSADVPKVSLEVWDQVCITDNKDENERLEFLGDSLMYTCIAVELYERIPDGSPHMYTVLRSSLHSNLTFCHLANKMNITRGGNVKTIGDIFESILGAYFKERGLPKLQEWVKRTYDPIIIAAMKAFENNVPAGKARASNTSVNLASGSSTNPTRAETSIPFSETSRDELADRARATPDNSPKSPVRDYKDNARRLTDTILPRSKTSYRSNGLVGLDLPSSSSSSSDAQRSEEEEPLRRPQKLNQTSGLSSAIPIVHTLPHERTIPEDTDGRPAKAARAYALLKKRQQHKAAEHPSSSEDGIPQTNMNGSARLQLSSVQNHVTVPSYAQSQILEQLSSLEDSSPVSPFSPSSTSMTLPAGWEILYSDGRPYYVDHVSRSTTWIHPSQWVQAGWSYGRDTLPQGWDPALTAEGRLFFIDHNTRSTSWTRP